MELIDDNALPVLSKDVIPRNDANGILLFHVYTDEMYFVSSAVYNSFIKKCNGSQTFREIFSELYSNFSTKEGKKYIKHFVNELLKRRILELW